jgi:hypothetical protein
MKLRSQMRRLFEVITADFDSTINLRTAIECSPPLALPLPQLTWTVFALIRYRQQRMWAFEVAQERLKDQVRRVAEGEDAILGIVPGLPDWSYNLGQDYNWMTHRGTGEKIHIDLPVNQERFDTSGFDAFLMTSWEPLPASGQVNDLFPAGCGIDICLSMLDECRLLSYDVQDIRLGSRLRSHTESVQAFLERWSNVDDQLRLAVLIGDWPTAHAEALRVGDSELAALLSPRAKDCRRRWLATVRSWGGYGVELPEYLVALEIAGEPDMPQFIEDALSSHHAVDVAISMIEDDPSWHPKVFDLLADICADEPVYRTAENPSEGTCSSEPPVRTKPPTEEWSDWPDLTLAYVSFLMRHHYRVPEVMAFIMADERAHLDDFIPLTLEHARDWFLPVVRRALRSRRKFDRETAAAVLALFDTPWSRREMLECLRQSGDWDATLECREALRQCHVEEAHQAVAQWELEHPRSEEAVPATEESAEKKNLRIFIARLSERTDFGPDETGVRGKMKRLFKAVKSSHGYAPSESNG